MGKQQLPHPFGPSDYWGGGPLAKLWGGGHPWPPSSTSHENYGSEIMFIEYVNICGTVQFSIFQGRIGPDSPLLIQTKVVVSSHFIVDFSKILMDPFLPKLEVVWTLLSKFLDPPLHFLSIYLNVLLKDLLWHDISITEMNFPHNIRTWLTWDSHDQKLYSQ